ncbi:hypothetical protein SDC9_129473 [bioreactor metagenome]|uniref:Uncharacterized protein n=1 Tax=bioreactor metagenome TaxID=1076179 RepID=A0A645D0T1_9ZZZZ
MIAVGLSCYAGLVLFLGILPSRHICSDRIQDVDHQGTYHGPFFLVDVIMGNNYRGSIQFSTEATSLYENGGFYETRISTKAMSKDEILVCYRYVKSYGLIQDI